MNIELECIDWYGETFNQDAWHVKNGDLINFILGDRRAVIRIDKGKIAYVVIEKINEGGFLQEKLGEIDLYEK